ncbi:MAG: ATP-dependent DNA helicase RecG, partial [Lachnospiraceae bacterium]|nr:ATP-dependent DNA helicase RecG [Lachnospiraceae bacterium]
AQSYCIMLQTTDSRQAKERLDILTKSNDGFFIAGADLKMRGPGDFFGIRQSGLMEFKLADVFSDADMLSAASGEAKAYVQSCRSGSENAYPPLEERLRREYRAGDNNWNL